ncbi:MAG TPA: dTDP-4-dehydrorhamnose reductase [Candidatus Obscuribacterales bacterium]
MKILLLGKNGQVGWELQRTLSPLGDVISLGRNELDLANFTALRETVRSIEPQLIVNAAAYTAVDKAESEAELAMAINGTAPGILAEEAARCKAALIHYSTDYVFDGSKTTPYVEDDEPNPINVYGKTKLAGEVAIAQVEVPYLIFRTSWVYGSRGKNFLLTILRLAKEREELKIVNDQIGSPTWSRMIAEATAQAIAQCNSTSTRYRSRITEVAGIYHLTAAEQTSWYGFAKAILETNAQFSTDALPNPKLLPIPSVEYPTPAGRPTYSVLKNDKINKIFAIKIPDWQSQLRMALSG